MSAIAEGYWNDKTMKPMIILPPDLMSEQDIKVLRENGICVVVATDPAKVRFVDPLPAVSSRTDIENAAIKFSRVLLNRQWGDVSSSGCIGISEFARIYLDCLLEGTPLSKAGTKEEQTQRYLDQVKLDELDRLAREEAKEERAAMKASKAKK